MGPCDVMASANRNVPSQLFFESFQMATPTFREASTFLVPTNLHHCGIHSNVVLPPTTLQRLLEHPRMEIKSYEALRRVDE